MTEFDEVRELRRELVRLTDALHAVMQHPDFTYIVTYGGSAAPPNVGQFGARWEPNPETPGHGQLKAGFGAWYWRRRKEEPG